MVDGGIGGGGGGRQAACFNDGCAAFADGGQEYVGVPVLVVNQVFHALAADGGKTVVGVHGGRVVAPNAQFFDVAHGFAGFFGQLAGGTVVVEAQHGGEVLGRQVGGGFHGDVGVGVGRIADHQDFNVAASDFVQCRALNGEDLCVGLQQVGTFHAGAARTGTHQDGDVGVFEGDFGVVGGNHAVEQWEGAVLQFHHHALYGFLGLR